MAIISCLECAEQISDTAAACPYCGAKRNGPASSIAKIVLRVAVGMVMFAAWIVALQKWQQFKNFEAEVPALKKLQREFADFQIERERAAKSAGLSSHLKFEIEGIREAKLSGDSFTSDSGYLEKREAEQKSAIEKIEAETKEKSKEVDRKLERQQDAIWMPIWIALGMTIVFLITLAWR